LPTGQAITEGLFRYLFPSTAIKHPRDLSRLTLLWNQLPFEHLFEKCPDHSRLAIFFDALFGGRAPNPVHSAIVEAVCRGGVSAVVTTNYDHGLDGLLTSSCGRKDLYLKVHGSLGDPHDPIVYSLTQEAQLPKHKHDALAAMLVGADLITIGYSGLDFELCPEIGAISAKGRVYWNITRRQYDARNITHNARLLVENTHGAFVVGDMRRLLSVLIGRDVSATLNCPTTEITSLLASVFTDDERQLWAARLLNNLGLPSLLRDFVVCACAQPYSQPSLWLSRECAQAAYHTGFYLQSAILFSKAGSRIADVDAQVYLLLDAAEAFRTAGAFYRAGVSLARAQQLLSRLPDHSRLHYYGRICLRNALLLTDERRFFGLMSNRWILRLWRRRTVQLLHEAERVGHETGSWFMV
jgi:hypothetical protein